MTVYLYKINNFEKDIFSRIFPTFIEDFNVLLIKEEQIKLKPNELLVSIGTINLHNKAVIMWYYMLDDKHGPARPGGCDICLGAIDIDSKDYATLTKNSHYYVMAHLSKVIHPGANPISIGRNRRRRNSLFCFY